MQLETPIVAEGGAIADRKKAEAFAHSFAHLAPAKPATLAEERRRRKQRLAGGFRIFAALGLAEGVAGHITARDPEQPDTFWVNPFGMGFDRIRTSDLIRVDAQGEVVEGAGPLNVSAFAIHAAIHTSRPEIVAARIATRSMARRGRQSGGCSTRSLRTPAPSSRTTSSSTTLECW